MPFQPPFYAVCALPLSLLVAACGQKDAPGAAANSTSSDTVEPARATQAGVSVSGARLVLPAVNGRPGAVYFTLSNPHDRGETLVGAAVRRTRKAQMHETSGGSMTALKSVALPARGTVTFAPGGRHVMVFGLPADLRAGATSELTLSFSDGRRVSTPLAVSAPGTGGNDGMAGMNMAY